MSADDESTAPVGAVVALDALAIAVTAARLSGTDDAITTGMQAAFGTIFDEITRRAAVNLAAAFATEGVPADSPAAQAALAGARQSVEEAVSEFYKLLAGSIVLSTHLLVSVMRATGHDSDSVLADVAKEMHDA